MKTFPFLEIATQGKNTFWHYAFSLSFILGSWIFLGSAVAAALLLFQASADASAAFTFEINTPLAFSAFMLSFVPWLAATLIAVRWVHRRPIRTLITAAPRPRLRRIAQGFGYWLILMILASLVEAWLYRGRYTLSFPPEWWRFLLPALILIPIQTSTEEVFFRGYLLQALGLKIRNLPLLILLSGFFFALPHIFNPEVSVSFWPVMGSYFLTGAFTAWITLRDGGLELALGMHAANNLYALIANYPNSAINIPSIFAIRELDAVYGLIAQIIACVIFFWLVFRPRRAQDERI
ncbi:MAG: type II CAAX endopeptidase family protein [Anaerolineales bacterium]